MPRCSIVAILTFAAVVTCNCTAPLLATGQGGAHAPVPFGQPRPGSYDDGWRRTADGWENIADWRAVVASAEAIDQDLRWRVETVTSPDELALVPGWRLDFHPAGLALLQVALLAWLAGFSATTRSAEPTW